MEKVVSRQRQWQLRQQAQGLCMTCGRKKVYRSQRCREHYEKNLVGNRAYWKRTHSLEAAVGG